VTRMRARTLLALALLAGVVAWTRRRSRLDPVDLWVDGPGAPPEAPVAPLPVSTLRRGSRDDRGAGSAIGMDLERARAAHVEPVVEFLTYVQRRRGDRAHLLFVRSDDLDAMAEAAEEPVDDFLSRLDQLGVVVSHN
jgi:hypothetical protein